MATQLLVNVLTVTNLAGGASVTLAHGLRSNDHPVTPTQVLCDRASPLVVTASNSTSITVNNPTAGLLSANFRCEFDHSIHAVGATPTKWTGVPFAAASVAVYGNFYSNIDQTIADNLVDISLAYFEGGYGNGVSVVDPGTGFKTNITVASAGVYAFGFSPQLFKAAGGGDAEVSFWLRKNGTDVPETASFVHARNNQFVLPFVEIVLPLNAGDNVAWAMHATLPNVKMEQQPASVAPAIVRPEGPSVITTVKYLGV